jgi:hypothetical protein
MYHKVYVGGMGRWAKNAEFCLVVENWQTQVQCLPASLSAFRPCPWGLYFVGGGHGLSAQSISKPPQQALVGWALQPTGFLLSFCRDPYTTVLASSCQGGKATTTMSFSAWAPCCLYFSAGPCQTPSHQPPLSTVSHLHSVTRCPKTPWTVIIPCFQVFRVA